MYVNFTHLENNWLAWHALHLHIPLGSDSHSGVGSDGWQILCVPFLSLLALSMTLLSHPRFAELQPSALKLLYPGQVLRLVSSTCFNRVYTPLQPTSVLSYMCVVSFDLEYIFLWAEPILLGHGSTQAWGLGWFTFAWGLWMLWQRPQKGEIWRSRGQRSYCSVQGPYPASDMALEGAGRHFCRWDLWKLALPLKALLYAVLHCLGTSIVQAVPWQVRNQMHLGTYPPWWLWESRGDFKPSEKSQTSVFSLLHVWMPVCTPAKCGWGSVGLGKKSFRAGSKARE